MKIRTMLLFFLVFFSACSAHQTSKQLPGGYKVLVMNAQEIYLADRNNELLIGPGLRKIGVTKHHVVAFCEPPSSGYIGNLRTAGYNVLEVATGKISTGLSEQQAKALLAGQTESFPEMASFDTYQVISQ